MLKILWLMTYPQESFIDFFEAAGWKVVVVRDIKNLKKALKSKYDVLLLDLPLPKRLKLKWGSRSMPTTIFLSQAATEKIPEGTFIFKLSLGPINLINLIKRVGRKTNKKQGLLGLFF